MYDTNQNIIKLKGDFKRLIQHNSEKIANLNTHTSDIDKFNIMTKKKIEELFIKIKDSNMQAQERSEGVERRITTKLERFKDQTEQKFDHLRDGNSSIIYLHYRGFQDEELCGGDDRNDKNNYS